MVARAWHDLSGKVAVVYGASRGLGRVVAVQLAAAGATVACGARGIDGLRRTAARIEADFHETYQELYSRRNLSIPIEVQNWRLRSLGPEPQASRSHRLRPPTGS